VDMDVFLVNGHKVTVNIRSADKTNDVLEVRIVSVCNMLKCLSYNLQCRLTAERRDLPST